jgi:RHH-type proline utilization regulon transcriptional repressor/proline dehydrogenase/delta 1-pyrroline-5-carboxylate dehydrogenase
MESAFETTVAEIGRDLLDRARERSDRFWARERWEALLLRQLMSSAEFRVQALRFVDVLPALADDAELLRHLREYFLDHDLPLPGPARWAIEHASDPLGVHLAATAVRKAIQHGLAGRFIAGSNVREALQCAERLRREGMAFTVDLLGEATVSEAEAEHYLRRCLELLEGLAAGTARWKPAPLLDRTGGRACPRLNLSVKLSSLYSQLSPVDPAGSAGAAKERLRPILRAAQRLGAFICVDMEQYDFKSITLRVFRELLMEAEFRDWPDVGVAMQGYLRETESDLRAMIAWARERRTPITVRLVKGAYWDYETVNARQNGWPVPVWTGKWETDLAYERCVRLLLESHPRIETAVASHNARSLAFALACARNRGLSPGQYELQMLHGMADPLKEAAVELGERVRVYLPFGELIPGMAYLVRRLLENTDSQSFLRLSFAEDAPSDQLLAVPAPSVASPPVGVASEGTAFRSEPLRRFTDEEERAAFADAIARVREQLGGEHGLVVAGRSVLTGRWIESTNPARPDVLVGRVASAGVAEADAAVRSAAMAFERWRAVPANTRAGVLRKAAHRLRARRDEFAAWEIFEAGKSWREADADVTEAIDFLEYYAEEAMRLSTQLSMDVPGELNRSIYHPRGVTAVIPPWNFPLAILTGMTSAAIVTGNTVVLKPASQTSVIAAKFVELMAAAGLPAGVLQFVPGPGAEIGEHLVRHPQVHQIAFTGSQAVGCRIYRLAAELAPGQRHLKRVVAELGGKNAIIVDGDADLDDAVHGVLSSAFGYQGQKCSAASRVIVVGRPYTSFVSRLVEAARSLMVGMPDDPGTSLGPVIDLVARARIVAAIEAGKKCARVMLETDVSHLGEGAFVGPTIFADVPPESELAQEEIFGPVVAVMPAKDFTEAIAIANGTRFALTGGVYSRSPMHLERARRELEVGNLYLNRKITGAVVGRQPFGGFRLSGGGTRAGGPDYLLQFMELRTWTENTLRRGFAAETQALNPSGEGTQATGRRT